MKATISLEILIIFLFLTPVAFILLRSTNDLLRGIADGLEKTVILHKAAAMIKMANERVFLEGNITITIPLPRTFVIFNFNGRDVILSTTLGNRARAFLAQPTTGTLTYNATNTGRAIISFNPNGNSTEVKIE